MKRITVTTISVSGEQEISDVDAVEGSTALDCVDWDWARDFIGGWVEVIRVSQKSWLMVDDEGTLKSLGVNQAASLIAGRTIVGNAILVKST